MRNATRHILTFSLILSLVSLAMADTNDAFQFFQEEAKVVSASKRVESIRQAPVAIDVITAEDIRASLEYAAFLAAEHVA